MEGEVTDGMEAGGQATIATGETRYLYDGRRVIQERNSSNVPKVSYTRGLDLSGTFEGAGGIGRLLARSHGYSSGSWGTHSLYHADGGGNVTMLIDASTHEEKATYKYDPYGNTLSATGDLANANVYRFSSKEWHAPSGLYYYGFRFYEPNLQRWLNRDPIGERGRQNLFSFVRNQPVGLIDFWGLIDLMLLNRYKDTFLILQLEDIQFDSVLTVAGHGDPGHVEDSRYQSRFLYTPESLAKVIKAHKRYQPGMPVLLVSCHTGEDPPADRKRPDRITPPFAQRLAELLEAPVFAPVGALTGGLTVVDAQGFNGELRGFLPSIGLPASPYE